MDKLKRTLPRVIMGIMMVVLVVGIAITIVDICKEKSGGKKKINDDGQVVVLDDIPGKMDQHTLLLSTSQSNNGLVSTDEQFDTLIELLQGSFFRYTEDYESACDGDTWHYTYYGLDEGKLHSYNGYNYSVPVLLEISDILDSDKRDQAVIEPVKMGDSHSVLVDVVWDRHIEDKNVDEVVSTHWTFYYDGWVAAQETYQIGGTQSTKTWRLDDYTYGRLVRELNYHAEERVDEAAVLGEDYWTMTYYEESGEEIYSTKTTSIKGNIFDEIWDELQIPEEGFSYVDSPDAKTGYTTIYNVENYSIKIESINPGHTESSALFSTYFYWQDAEDSRTTIHMEYYFGEGSLVQSYAIDQMSTTTINGERYYYHVSRSDDWTDKLWIHYHVDNNRHMLIILETTGWRDQDYNWVDETDADIEELLQDEVIEEAINFKVIRK